MPRRRRRHILLLLALIIIGSALLIGLGCADRLILPPVPPPVAGDGSPRVMIDRGDGGVLESYRARSPGAAANGAEPRAFVLRFSGDANRAAQWTADRWRARPVEAWVVNYPGYGNSSGPRTLDALAKAALVAHDEMRRIAGDRPIILEGFSLGTTPALHIAANRPVAGLILQNPPPLRQVVLRQHGGWNLWLLAGPVACSLPKELDSLANARRCAAPATILVAENDRSIEPSLQREIFNAYAGEKQLIIQRGADHADPLDEPTMQQLQQAMDRLFPVP